MLTTHPSASTGHDRDRQLPQRIRWVFPSAQVTPSLRGHYVFGRDDSCDSVLPGTEVSRRHMEVVRDGPVLSVRDLGSRNGVFVNGIRRAEAPLLPGDVLRCGEWIGVIVADEDSEGFRTIVPGWCGGHALAAAAEQARNLRAELPVVIQGETGTGKEGMAHAVHEWSGRTGPFRAVNCAAIPAHIAEAELFGYRKGAFTGADQASAGLFRSAQGGTLFLDEILDLPAAIQAKLLRVLEQREVLSLGETKPVPIDVRIVAATQEPLANAVADRRFRADLHARLDGLTVVLPPLRDRREDIVPLFQEFLRQHAGGRPPALEPKLVEALVLYDWPLNVRELLQLAKRLLATHGGGEMLRKIHLPSRMLAQAQSVTPHGASSPSAPPAPTEQVRGARRSVEDAREYEALVAALRTHGGSVARAAAAIGVSRARAYRVLAAHPDVSLDDPNG